MQRSCDERNELCTRGFRRSQSSSRRGSLEPVVHCDRVGTVTVSGGTDNGLSRQQGTLRSARCAFLLGWRHRIACASTSSWSDRDRLPESVVTPSTAISDSTWTSLLGCSTLPPPQSRLSRRRQPDREDVGEHSGKSGIAAFGSRSYRISRFDERAHRRFQRVCGLPVPFGCGGLPSVSLAEGVVYSTLRDVQRVALSKSPSLQFGREGTDLHSARSCLHHVPSQAREWH